MKYTTLVLLFLVGQATAANPLFWAADPSAIVGQDGRVYIYPTNDKKNWNDQKNWEVWSSPIDDLESWTNHGEIFDTRASGWGIDNAWAPDIAYKNGTYYFYYYFQNGKQPGGIGVATSSSPTGPFQEVHGKRLIGGHDPALFRDDDGSHYLYVQDKVYLLNEDMVTLKSQEPISLDLAYRPKKFEAAYVFKRKQHYYFTVARGFNNLIYYMGQSPLGPFEYKGEIMKPVQGNNHHSIIKIKNRWVLFHHERATGSKVSNRRVRAEYLHFNPDGTIQLVEKTEQGISGRPSAQNYSLN